MAVAFCQHYFRLDITVGSPMYWYGFLGHK